jgi:hypothetical protein
MESMSNRCSPRCAIDTGPWWAIAALLKSVSREKMNKPRVFMIFKLQ